MTGISDLIAAATRRAAPLFILAFLGACTGAMEDISAPEDPDYAAVTDADITIPAVDPKYLVEPNRRATVSYAGGEAPGTIVVDPHAKFLFLVGDDGTAMRYPIAVGREGKGFSGSAVIGRKQEWPSWTPTANMIRTEPEIYGPFARGIPGGRANPLGARALYLYRSGRDTYFRIHGTNDNESIGNSGSAGCIRLFNQDIIDLFGRTPVGTRVVVRSYEQSVALEGLETANRGGQMQPRYVDPEVIYAVVEEEQARRRAAAQ